MTGAAKTRLLLVDDHEMVRAGLRALLGTVATLEIVGEAGDAAGAVRAAARLRPDVVLMDLRLPDASGVEACREIVSAAPQTRVLFLTSYSDEEAVVSTMLSGAAGYLLKDIGRGALVGAIEDAAHGRPVAEPAAVQAARERVRRMVDEAPPGGGVEALSPQERRILALVVEGKTNREIGAALSLSDKTVKNYLSNAFQKLRVSRRAQAAALFARERPKPARD